MRNDRDIKRLSFPAYLELLLILLAFCKHFAREPLRFLHASSKPFKCGYKGARGRPLTRDRGSSSAARGISPLLRKDEGKDLYTVSE